MLNEHTLDQLKSLRLDGMVRAIEEQATSTAASALGFDERLTLLVQSVRRAREPPPDRHRVHPCQVPHRTAGV